MSDTRQPLYMGGEWNFELLQRITEEIETIADEELACFTRYPMQIEIVSQMQMLDAITSNGMPIGYAHWSFGKRYLEHRAQRMGSMVYELVINTNPCLVYCVDSNTATLQTLVIAHAGIGHNAFFANNYLYRDWTHPEDILRYLKWGAGFIRQCEDKYGPEEVETVLDACHALQNVGVDRYRHPEPLSIEDEEKRQLERATFRQQHVNELWNSVLLEHTQKEQQKERVFPNEPQENILRFIEEHAPLLPAWKREVIRFVRKVGQYFFPNVQTHLMNEGFACFIHRYILERLYEKSAIGVGAYEEFLTWHTNVVYQQGMFEGRYSGQINPYALGYAMFEDIRRICEHPTDEDRKYLPEIAGKEWRAVILDAIQNYNDESFILQFLSPSVARKFGMFVLMDDAEESHYLVTAIQDYAGFEDVRRRLAATYSNAMRYPDIEVVNVDLAGDRMLTVRHEVLEGRYLEEEDAQLTLSLLHELWGFPVEFLSVQDDESYVVWRIDREGTLHEMPDLVPEEDAENENDDTTGFNLTFPYSIHNP